MGELTPGRQVTKYGQEASRQATQRPQSVGSSRTIVLVRTQDDAEATLPGFTRRTMSADVVVTIQILQESRPCSLNVQIEYDNPTVPTVLCEERDRLNAFYFASVERLMDAGKSVENLRSQAFGIPCGLSCDREQHLV